MGKRIDLTGKRFGRLIVTGYAFTRTESWGGKVAIWNCICDCGNKTTVKSELLRNGKVKSCGCLKHKHSYNFQDLTGQRFGRLTVVELHGSGENNTVWKCKCDCGNGCFVTTHNLRNGNTKSCGCFRKESSRKRLTTHGLSYTKLRKTWHNMIQRCENPNSTSYKNYGGRGIKVCPEWHDLESFAKWAYGNGFSECDKSDQTIERIDVNGNYEPGNCCFATREQQANNKRNNRRITHGEETHTVAEWSRITGIHQSTIKWRLNQGMKPEQILGVNAK